MAAGKAAPLEPPKSKKNGAAPRKVSRAEASKAIADIKNEQRFGTFRGVQFKLPASLPATFIFDVGEMQAGDGTDFSVVHRLMVGVLGAESWRAVRDRIASDGDSIDDLEGLMEELFAAVMAPFGMTPGESGASTAS